jgi:hypothetical protein
MSKEVDDLKQEATRLLEGMFRIPEGYSSGTLRRVVDCIVFAAAIQVAEWQRDAIKAVPPNP